MHPDHKVLTADLRYVPLRSLSIGDKIVSFDEGPSQAIGQRKGPRRFRTGTVTNLRMMRGEMFDVTLSGGKVFRVTADHKWLTKNSGSLFSWKRTDQLRKTRPVSVGSKGGGTRIVRLLDEFEHNKSWESGWLAGMYCGEGSLYSRTTTGGVVIQLALSQSESHNPSTCRRIEEALRNVCGVEPDGGGKRDKRDYRVRGGAKNVARVLGIVRPHRMLEKFKPEMLGSLGGSKCTPKAEFILSIEPVGVDEYLQIGVDTKTMVVEGYAHHNCYPHDEPYLNAQTNNHWRGILMLNEVSNGTFDAMQVSLKFLEERYQRKAA
jgi:hypothetical protein